MASVENRLSQCTCSKARNVMGTPGRVGPKINFCRSGSTHRSKGISTTDLLLSPRNPSRRRRRRRPDSQTSPAPPPPPTVSPRFVSLSLRLKMTEKAAAIGLSWAPKMPILSTGKSSLNSQISPQASLWKPASELVDGLFVPPTDPRKVNKMLRRNMKDTAGQSWFDMPAPTITPELKTDLELLKLRNVLDPKKHFKKGGDSKSKALPKYFQIGTVIEDPSEFYGRLTKKERKQTFAEELLADPNLKAYRKRKIKEIEEKNRPGGVEKWKNKGRQTRKSAKERRRG